MCVYSVIMDHYYDKWQPYRHPTNPPQPVPYEPYTTLPSPLSEDEIKDLRKDVKELKKLLEKAKKYDKETGQKDCELDSKKKKLQKLADELGIEIDFP